MHLPWRGMALGLGPAISTSLLAEEAAKLAELAKGTDVLEVGSAYGFSAITMALAGARVSAVDTHSAHASYQQMQTNLAVYNVSDRVDIIAGMSQVILPQLILDNREFDMVFIDGDHRAAGVYYDVTAAQRLVRLGGIIACHDYGEDCCCPEVRSTLDALYPGGPDEIVGTLFLVRV